MKIPEPIMAPTTTIMESNRPRPRENSRGLGSDDSRVACSSLAVKEWITFWEGLGLTIAYCIHKIGRYLTNSPSLIDKEQPPFREHSDQKGFGAIRKMRECHRIRVIDSHTGGEPTRLVVSGGPDVGDGLLAERLECFRTTHDHFRSAIVNEPRVSSFLITWDTWACAATERLVWLRRWLT